MQTPTVEQAAEHLRKVGILPPSKLSPQHVAARTFAPRQSAPVSWVPPYLRQLGLLEHAAPMNWPANVVPMRIARWTHA